MTDIVIQFRNAGYVSPFILDNLNHEKIMTMFDELSKAPTLLDAYKIVRGLIHIISHISESDLDANGFSKKRNKYVYDYQNELKK
jgi:hypothetical protein